MFFITCSCHFLAASAHAKTESLMTLMGTIGPKGLINGDGRVSLPTSSSIVAVIVEDAEHGKFGIVFHIMA